MTERFERFGNWEDYLTMARKNIGEVAPSQLWWQVYRSQVVFTELELRRLGVSYDTPPSAIPDINTVQNLDPVRIKTELGLIEIIGMPGAGKDTVIAEVEKQGIPNIACAPEEGYWWAHKESPFTKLRERHFQVYGGTDMEIDEVIDKLSFSKEEPTGAALLNRTIPDNFLAFGYSFFLSGNLGVKDLLLSQKMFHYFQYSPTKKVGDNLECLENITAATFIFMIRPEVTLERIPRRGRILETNFLNLLYSQYLRMISRLRTTEQRNLVVLDMSGTKEESLKLFNDAFNQVVDNK